MASIEQIRQWCNGKWIAKNDDGALIEYLNIDSRNLSFSETSLFVTIKTNLRDGHSFIGDAYKNGIRNFLVTKEILKTNQWNSTIFNDILNFFIQKIIVLNLFIYYFVLNFLFD